MNKKIIYTSKAPEAIGAYSQAVLVGNTLYCSGQIPLIPETMELIGESIDEQIAQVFDNLSAVVDAAGGDLDSFVKLNVYLTDLSHFAKVNKKMTELFATPYPARAAVEVKGLPKNVLIEIEGVALIG